MWDLWLEAAVEGGGVFSFGCKCFWRPPVGGVGSNASGGCALMLTHQQHAYGAGAGNEGLLQHATVLSALWAER